MSTGFVAALVLDFDPYLQLGDRAVRWEILAVAAAVLVGIVVAALLAGRTPGQGVLIGEEELPEEEREGPWHLRRDDLLFILLGAVPGAVVLGRLGYGLLHLDYYGTQWRVLLDPAQGSVELTLAVVGGTLTAVYVAALLDAPVGRWLHVAIAPLLLVLGLGKAAQALGGAGQGDSTATGACFKQLETDALGNEPFDPAVMPAKRVKRAATHGDCALYYEPTEKGGGLHLTNFDGDWRGFDVLRADFYNPSREPANGYFTITDMTTPLPFPRAMGPMAERFDLEGFVLPPGKSTLELKLGGLSTNGGRQLDLGKIRKIAVGCEGNKFAFYMDCIRLEKEK